jgi:hypothetical protein
MWGIHRFTCNGEQLLGVFTGRGKDRNPAEWSLSNTWGLIAIPLKKEVQHHPGLCYSRQNNRKAMNDTRCLRKKECRKNIHEIAAARRDEHNSTFSVSSIARFDLPKSTGRWFEAFDEEIDAQRKLK